ncbi:hypothetical protein ACH5RR_026706 [Cinchona calisaya]|uniref:F-box domain-containing protein n=1 Tax=Cinchona calisaya TaxID=153742 RepID=A0ABD2Z3D8_9GENT
MLMMKSRIRHIPEEIIDKILSKLSVKSLARFKCVSKTWKSLISNMEGQERSFFYLEFNEGNMLFYAVDKELVVEKLPTPFLGLSSKENFKFLGSCNGLLLFSVSRCIYLWNPTTRCCKEVLQLNFLSEKFLISASGICFDDSTNDYKVVMSLASYTIDMKFALVGSLKSKEWSQINFPYAMARSGCYVNGRLHWIVREKKLDAHSIVYSDPKTHPQLIVYFDAKTLEFKELPMPDNVYIIGELKVVDGCLCMAHRTNYKCKILIMKEYGVKESWTTIWNGAVPKWKPKGQRFRRPGINSQILTNTSEELLVAKFRRLWAFSVWGLKLNLKENSVEFPSKNCSDDMSWDTYIESLAPVHGETPDINRHMKKFEDKIRWLPESNDPIE